MEGDVVLHGWGYGHVHAPTRKGNGSCGTQCSNFLVGFYGLDSNTKRSIIGGRLGWRGGGIGGVFWGEGIRRRGAPVCNWMFQRGLRGQRRRFYLSIRLLRKKIATTKDDTSHALT